MELMSKLYRLVFVAILAVACVAPSKTLTEENVMQPQSARNAMQLPIEGEMPAFEGATGWLNSKPLTKDSLRGKVVLVEFWTYTCINWLRTAPYVRAWAEKYKDKGLVVIGVHTPEFEFEKDIENVRRETANQNVGYPVAIDNDYAVWSAFSNRYWPALYFVDAAGRIRHHHFGEGEYDRSERVIQQLLSEAGNGDGGNDLVSVEGQGLEAPADWNDLRSPENYLGYARTVYFASPGGVALDARHIYELPKELMLNEWALAGGWTVGLSATASNTPNAKIAYRFHARDLHLVMSTPVSGTPVRFRVTIDGEAPGSAHGVDVDEQGNGVVTQPRLYQLIRQAGPIDDRHFEIEFLDAGVEAHVFTFG
jgi:thiol-disulfide isomerase/thioredoxin